MAIQFLPQSRLAQAAGAGRIDFSPLTEAIEGVRRNRLQEASQEMAQKRFEADEAHRTQQLALQTDQLGLQKQTHQDSVRQQERQFGLQQQQAGLQERQVKIAEQTAAEAQQQATARKLAATVQALMSLPPDQQAAGYAKMRAQIPDFDADIRAAGLDPEDMPTTARFILERALPGGGKPSIHEVGGRLVQTTPRGQASVIYDPGQVADPSVQRNVTGGLKELASIPDRYPKEFESAVGPFQGDESFNFGLGPLARAWGSLTATAVGGVPPAEVRRAIDGATNTLASVLKPLIRKPGEGAWSDRDQAVLNSIVGNLTQAKDRTQYLRELENVRQRINSNFNLNLPPVTTETGAASGQGGPPAYSDEVYSRLKAGDRYVAPDGTIRVKR